MPLETARRLRCLKVALGILWRHDGFLITATFARRRRAVSTFGPRQMPATRKPPSRYTKTPASQATRNFGDQRYDATRTFAIILGMDRQLIYPEECYAMRGAIYEVYRELGNGFREEVYQQQAWSAHQFRRISQSRCRAVGELTSQFFVHAVSPDHRFGGRAARRARGSWSRGAPCSTRHHIQNALLV